MGRKKKKHVLTVENDLDFDLIGLCSHHNDYRLAWGINAGMDLKLEKSEDDYCTVNKKGETTSTHSVYKFSDEAERIDYFLIKNKCQGNLLIHEKPTIDYFLFLSNNHVVDVDQIIEKLKGVSSVLAAYYFSPDEIESVNNIVLF